MYARADKRSTLARRDSALVIEGFPRSGNTFSVAAFQIANGPQPHLGRHLHGAPHLLRAKRLGIPAVALVRAPEDAVPSYLIRRAGLRAEDVLVEYLDFYRTAWPARDAFVVGLFDDVTRDFGTVIDLESGGEVVETLVGRPSAERDSRKAEIATSLQRPRAARMLDEARQLFQQYVARAARQGEGT